MISEKQPQWTDFVPYTLNSIWHSSWHSIWHLFGLLSGTYFDIKFGFRRRPLHLQHAISRLSSSGPLIPPVTPSLQKEKAERRRIWGQGGGVGGRRRGRKEGRKEGGRGGREGRKGRKEGRTEGRTDGRKERSSRAALHLCYDLETFT